jgi:Tol biopolymer transport system component
LAADRNQVVIDRTGAFATPLASVQQPVDAVPTRNAGGFYFVASDDDGPGVYLVSHAGGQVTTIYSGAALSDPENLALSDDNERIFVADRSAGGGGQVVVLDAFGGGVLRTFAEGYQPRGVDTTLVDGRDMVYFSGIDPADSQAGVFRSAWDGSDLEVVAKGAQLTDPSGVAVAANGVVYVSDTPGVRGAGEVLSASDGALTRLLSGVWLGTPGGVALTTDGNTLAVSGLTPATGGATVYLVNTTTGTFTTRDDGIAQNRGAGGVHRAKNDNVFGWADSSRSGKVYRVEP